MTTATTRNPFSALVTAAIIANLPIAVWSEITENEIAEHLDAALLLFFAVEVSVRVACAVKRRRWDAWLAFDAVIVALAILPFGIIPVVRAAKLAHMGRHAVHLKHVTLARAAHV